MVSLKVKIADFADLKDIAELQATIKAHFENSLDKEKPSIVEIIIGEENSCNGTTILVLILLELKNYRNCKKFFNVGCNSIEYGFWWLKLY